MEGNNSKKEMYITPLFYSIGNAAEDIHWAYKRASLDGKKVKIIAPYSWTQILKYKICNKELFSLLLNSSNTVGVFEIIYNGILRFYVNIVFSLKRTIGIIFRTFFKKELSDEWYFPEIGFNEICQPFLNDNTNSLYRDPILEAIHKKSEIHLSKKINKECFDALSEYGIDLECERFVCLHVRDGGYYKDYNKRPYRNANIDNYHEAIDFLLENGFYVFRLGDANMKRLAVNKDKVIDYPFTKLKSAAMDLFLISKCEFYIGMQSGILDVALLFERPILLLNMYNCFHGSTQKVCDRGLLKKIIMPDGSEVKTLKQRVNLPFYYNDWRSDLDVNDIMFVENDSREILLAVKEFYKDYQSGFTRK